MFSSTKVIELGSCAFRQPRAKSHCSFLHGYRLTAKFWFEADELDENNWVVDFGGLKKLKLLMEDMFDHTTVIARDDPHLLLFMDLEEKGIIVLNIMENGVGIERFAEWCCETADEFVRELTDGRCRCVKAEVFEHEKNSAIYQKTTRTVTVPELTEKQKEQLIQEVKQINEQSTVEDDTTLYDFMGNKNKRTETPNEGAAVNTNSTKTTNKWINPDSKNVWGL